MRARWLAALGLALVPATPAAAERLFTLWKLEPTVAAPPSRAVWGEPFLEQRLLPVKLVRLTDPVMAGDQVIVAGGSFLFLVYNAAGKTGYCTVKDRSMKNQARTLFIPILDRRPCLTDRDGDGRFDASFTVFDKYGSAATPSGSLDGATALAKPVAYQAADPHLFPVAMKIAFELGGKKVPEKVQVRVKMDKAGRGKWEYWDAILPRAGRTIGALNAEVEVKSVTGREAAIDVRLDPGIYIRGESGGRFVAGPLPSFLNE
ncbi:MAG TPA: hypothetical protein VHM92_01675 [Allosphingosinicella sp.]|nr:hypothetical protein [Allosphingosinicella sp.]